MHKTTQIYLPTPMLEKVIREETDSQELNRYFGYLHKEIAKSNYFTFGKIIIKAFADNENTPFDVVCEFVLNQFFYGSPVMGIEPAILAKLKNHISVSHLNGERRKTNMEKVESIFPQEEFDKMQQSEEDGQEALANDAELISRITSVQPERLSDYLLRFKYDPKNVEAVGLDFFKRHFVSLYNPLYDPETGVVIGQDELEKVR